MSKRGRDLFTQRKPRRMGCLIYPLLMLLVCAALLTLNVINNGRVVLQRQSVTVPALPSELEKFRILHISDLRGRMFGEGQRDIADLIAAQTYGAVCVTGDVCAPGGDYSAFQALLAAIGQDIPVFFVAGDEDPAPLWTTAHDSDSVLADYILAAQAMGAIYLDAPCALTVGGQTVWFCPETAYGLDVPSTRAAYQARRAALTADDRQYLPDTAAQIRAVDYRMTVLERLEEAAVRMRKEDVQVLLLHHPLTHAALRMMQQTEDGGRADYFRGVSLVLAGHYNAGQYRLPGVGPIKAPSSAGLGKGWFPGEDVLHGLQTVQGVTQYISPGLGVLGENLLPLRLFNTPAITIITLTVDMTD